MAANLAHCLLCFLWKGSCAYHLGMEASRVTINAQQVILRFRKLTLYTHNDIGHFMPFEKDPYKHRH
jgi:hypothetical protein